MGGRREKLTSAETKLSAEPAWARLPVPSLRNLPVHQGPHMWPMSCDESKEFVEDAKEYEKCIQSGEITIDEALSLVGFGWGQYLVLCACSTALICDGMEKTVLALLYPNIAREWALSPSQLGLLGSMSGLGMTIGAVAIGRASDFFGRRISFLFSLFLCGFGGLCVTMVNSFPMFVFFRMVTAVGVGGGFPVSLTMVNEAMPPELRQKWSARIQVSLGIGRVTVALLAWGLLPYWRLLCLAVTAVDVVAVAIIWFWLPESPKYLVANGKLDEARASLRKIAHQNGKHLPDHIFDGLCESRKPLPIRNDAFLSTTNPDNTTLQQKTVDDDSEKNNPFSWNNEYGVFSPSVWLLFGAWFMMSVGTEYGSWYPTVLTNIKIFGARDRALWLIVFNFCEIVSPFALSMLAHLKLEMIVLASVLSSCTAALFARQIYIGATGVIIAMAGCLASWTYVLVFVLMYTITPELFPTSVRNTIFGMATGCYRFGSVLAPLLYTAIMFNPKTKKDGSAKSTPEFLGTMIHAGNKKKGTPSASQEEPPVLESKVLVPQNHVSVAIDASNSVGDTVDDADLDAMESLFDLHGLTVEAQNSTKDDDDDDIDLSEHEHGHHNHHVSSLLEQIYSDPHHNHRVNKQAAVNIKHEIMNF